MYSIETKTLTKKFKDKMFQIYCNVGDKIEEGRFREALQDIISLIKSVNKYFDDEKPWVTIKNNKEKCAQSMYICIQYIGNLSNLIEPFMPFTAEKIRRFLCIKEPIWRPIEIKEGKIHDIQILFERLDKSISDDELKKLKEEKF